MTDFQMHGHSYQRARKAHTCWGCGRVIAIGERYWKCLTVTEGRAKSINTCWPECEMVVDVLDQHQTMAAQAVAYPTFPAYMKDNPDAFKE